MSVISKSSGKIRCSSFFTLKKAKVKALFITRSVPVLYCFISKFTAHHLSNQTHIIEMKCNKV